MTVAAQLVWTNRLLSDVSFRRDGDGGGRGEVDLAISGQKRGGGGGGCLYDPIVIKWSNSGVGSDELRIAVAIDGRDEIAIGSILTEDTALTFSPSSSGSASRIRCAINELHCIPTVANIVAMTKGVPSVTVHFKEGTDTPDLSSSKLLLAALLVTPPMVGEASGTWIDEKTLSIAVDQSYLQDIVGAHTRGENIDVTVRFYAKGFNGRVAADGSADDSAGDVDADAGAAVANQSPVDDDDAPESTKYCSAEYLRYDINNITELSDKNDVRCRQKGVERGQGQGQGQASKSRHSREVVIRPTEHGATRIFAVNATSLSVVSNILHYDVRTCGGELIPPLTLRRQRGSDISDGSGSGSPPVAAIRMRGVLALTGKDPIVIPHDAVPQMVRHSCSYPVCYSTHYA